jgi:hypothetical protein
VVDKEGERDKEAGDQMGEELLNPAKQSKQAKQASKQANQQIGLG